MLDQQIVIDRIVKVIAEIGAPASKANMFISKDNDCDNSYNVVVSRDFMDEAYDHYDFYLLQDLAEELNIEIMPCSGATHATTIHRF